MDDFIESEKIFDGIYTQIDAYDEKIKINFIVIYLYIKGILKKGRAVYENSSRKYRLFKR